jgi:hypothetical protein
MNQLKQSFTCVFGLRWKFGEAVKRLAVAAVCDRRSRFPSTAGPAHQRRLQLFTAWGIGSLGTTTIFWPVRRERDQYQTSKSG